MLDDYSGSEEIRQVLLNAPKFGNDLTLPDSHAGRVMGIFHDALAEHRNTRGGPYVPGFYSSTTHVGFGCATGRSPERPEGGGDPSRRACAGKRDGPPGPHGHAELRGPGRRDACRTATRSTSGSSRAPGGGEGPVPPRVARARILRLGAAWRCSSTWWMRHDLKMRGRHPGRYPGLVVRVAGYCAYFDDLPDAVKDEIRSRTSL